MTTNTKICVTGPTGGLGSAVLAHLLKIVPPSQIIVSLHNPTGLSKQFAELPDLTVRAGADYNKPETLDYTGAERLFLVSYPSIAHELRVKNHITAIEAAKKAGVKHIFYSSLAFGDGSVTNVMKAHLDTEAYLRQCGLKYTIIREGLYAESFPLYLGFFDAKTTKEIGIPGDGKIAWAVRDELGEGTAKILSSTDPVWENSTHLITGPKSYTLKELADIIAGLLHITLPVKYITTEEYIEQNKHRGDYVEKWAATYAGLERGEVATITPLLEQLIGRKPKTMEEIIPTILENNGALVQYGKNTA